MRYFLAFIALLFLLFAVAQFNDPDPLGWVVIYGAVGVCFGLAAFGKYQRWLALLILAVCAVWMFRLLPDFIEWVRMGMPTIVEGMKAEAPHVELTREFLGLLLCVVALGCLVVGYARRKVVK